MAFPSISFEDKVTTIATNWLQAVNDYIVETQYTNLKYFPGIDFTGTTDSTAGVQAAFNYCAANNIPLYSGKGTVLCKDVQIPAGLIFKGWGRKVFKFKLPASANAGATVMYGTSVSAVELSNFTIDGNKAAQTNYANLILFQSGCYDINVSGVRIINGYGSNGSGLTLINTSDEFQGTQSTANDCKFSDIDGIAFSCSKAFNVRLTKCYFNACGDGAAFLNLTNPPPNSPTEQNILVRGNQFLNITRAGLSFGGYIVGYNSSSQQISGAGKPTASDVVIAGNLFKSCGTYGLVYQSTSATISNNVIRGCGSDVTNGGALINASYVEFTSNIVEANFFYGVDAGGSIHCNFTSNTFSFNGTEGANGASGLNLGAAQNCAVKSCKFIQNGDAAAGAQINIAGYDGGVDPVFPTSTTNIVIDNCEFTLANNNQRGVSCGIGNPTNIVIRNCNVYGGAINNAYVVEANQFYHSKNLYWNGAIIDVSVAAAASVVIPDYTDDLVISGVGNIDFIRTVSANSFLTKVRGVRMTNNGTGYTPGLSFSVAFSGGGGAGAAGTALVGNDGKVYAVVMTNNGTGYTSNPTVDFSAGTGSGAAGVAMINCNNTDGNYLTVYLSSTAVLKTGTGNMVLSGGDFTGTGQKSITLFGRNGGLWYEVSRS